jgi:hypothetical protein
MSGKRNWNRELERRRAQEHGTASVYRGGPSTRPRSAGDRDGAAALSQQADADAVNSRALWTFMRELARCDINRLPTPAVPKEALSVVGVTSQTLALAWIRRHRSYEGIKRQLMTEKSAPS